MYTQGIVEVASTIRSTDTESVRKVMMFFFKLIIFPAIISSETEVLPFC